MELIDRQAAIDAIEEMQIPIMRSEFLDEQLIFTGMSEALAAIKELPSAHPKTEERTAESVQNVSNSDLISRKLAIDATWKEPTYAEVMEELTRKLDGSKMTGYVIKKLVLEKEEEQP